MPRGEALSGFPSLPVSSSWVYTVGHLKFAPKNANLTRSSLLRDLYKFFNS